MVLVLLIFVVKFPRRNVTVTMNFGFIFENEFSVLYLMSPVYILLSSVGRWPVSDSDRFDLDELIFQSLWKTTSHVAPLFATKFRQSSLASSLVSSYVSLNGLVSNIVCLLILWLAVLVGSSEPCSCR